MTIQEVLNSIGLPVAYSHFKQKQKLPFIVYVGNGQEQFVADNTKYWMSFTDNGLKGDLEVSRFPDEFKTQFLGFVVLADGGLAAVKGAQRKPVYLAFQTQGDQQKRRGICYNVSLGAIDKEYKTIEKSIDPVTEKIDIAIVGDNKTGITVVGYTEGSAGYDTLFTSPPKPILPTSVPGA